MHVGSDDHRRSIKCNFRETYFSTCVFVFSICLLSDFFSFLGWRGGVRRKVVYYCIVYNITQATHINRLRARAIISYRVRENRKGPSHRDRQRLDPIWEIEHTHAVGSGEFLTIFYSKIVFKIFPDQLIGTGVGEDNKLNKNRQNDKRHIVRIRARPHAYT